MRKQIKTGGIRCSGYKSARVCIVHDSLDNTARGGLMKEVIFARSVEKRFHCVVIPS